MGFEPYAESMQTLLACCQIQHVFPTRIGGYINFSPPKHGSENGEKQLFLIHVLLLGSGFRLPASNFLLTDNANLLPVINSSLGILTGDVFGDIVLIQQ